MKYLKLFENFNNITSEEFEIAISNLSSIIDHIAHSYLHKQNIPHGEGAKSEELKIVREIKENIKEKLRRKDPGVIAEIKNLIGDNLSLNNELKIIMNYKPDELKTQVLDKFGGVQKMFEVESNYDLEYPVYKFTKFEEDAINQTEYKIKLNNALFVEGNTPMEDITKEHINKAKSEGKDGVIFSFNGEIFYSVIFDEQNKIEQ